MRKTIIFIMLLSVIGLFGNIKPTDTVTLEGYDSSDIIKYYQLYDKIDALEAKIDTLEQKMAVLEKAVEREVFDGVVNSGVTLCAPKAVDDVTTVTCDKDKVISKLTKEIDRNYNDTMEEIILLWEAVWKLEDGK